MTHRDLRLLRRPYRMHGAGAWLILILGLGYLVSQSGGIGSGSSSSGSYGAPPGSFQACVIQRESSGDPHAVNASSGAGGLYQFLPSTWQELGYSGSPQDAPVWVQNQAFRKAYRRWGTQPWAPSDGC